MKRQFVVSAKDANTKVRITVLISSDGCLTRSEILSICNRLASELMTALPRIPYSDFSLHKIKTKGL